MDCIRAHHDPPVISSKRTPDPGTTCKACSKIFFRRLRETLRAYKERQTCNRICGRALQLAQAPTKSEYGYATAKDFACQNCTGFWNDSDIGEQCGPCDAGQNFRRKK